MKFFAFLNACYPKTHLTKALNSLGSFRPYGELLENQEEGGSRELFLPENDFQTSFTKNFLKKNPFFGCLGTKRRYKIQA